MNSAIDLEEVGKEAREERCTQSRWDNWDIRLKLKEGGAGGGRQAGKRLLGTPLHRDGGGAAGKQSQHKGRSISQGIKGRKENIGPGETQRIATRTAIILVFLMSSEAAAGEARRGAGGKAAPSQPPRRFIIPATQARTQA